MTTDPTPVPVPPAAPLCESCGGSGLQPFADGSMRYADYDTIPPAVPGPADVELVAQTLWDQCGEPSTHPTSVCYDDAIVVLSVLAAAGRLLPPDAETRTECEIHLASEKSALDRRTAYYYYMDADELQVRLKAAAGAGYRPERIVRRTVTTWPDGSTLVGPWLPVPTEETP